MGNTEEKSNNHMKLDQETGTLIITLQNFDGSRLSNLQKSILLGIEEIGCSELSGCEDYRNAVSDLTDLLRAIMLDESQTNVALAGRPYKKRKSISQKLKDPLIHGAKSKNNNNFGIAGSQLILKIDLLIPQRLHWISRSSLMKVPAYSKQCNY